ncbi:MAG: NAD(+) synthase [Fibrobacteria bacterium]
MTNPFSSAVLDLDCAAETERIGKLLSDYLQTYRRKGYIVGLSGGIDSSVTLALCVKALGKDRVFGLHMPERDSSEDTLGFSRLVAGHFGVASELEDITAMLDAAGCYRRRDDAIRSVIPEYREDWKCKIVLPSVAEKKGYNFFSVVARAPSGDQIKKRLPLEAYLGVVAASNFKQRIRKMFEYYHADRLNYATTGTPNRLEYDQGFFVKQGDGLADVKPIAHLYKTQVYALAEYLGVPETIRRRPPTTDTYSLEQGQDEFYFSLAYDKMDLCLYAKNHGVPAAEVAAYLGMQADQIERVYLDIDGKRNATGYLHAPPQLVTAVAEVS